MNLKLFLCIVALFGCVWCAGPVKAQWVSTNIAYAKRDVAPQDYFPDDTNTYYEVRGRITSQSFATNTLEFYIEDTNDNVGIRVDSALAFSPTLYTEVGVIGRISQTAGVRRISPQFAGDLYVVDATAVPVLPVSGTISQLLANAERYEGTFVVISNIYAPTNVSFTYGASANVTITDATGRITLRVDVDTDIDGQLVPTNVFTLFGIFSQFDTSATPTGGYQVLPRFYTDIVQSTEAQPPQILVLSSSAFSVVVGHLLSINLVAQDRNPEDNLTLSLPAPPSGASVQRQQDRLWTFTWTPNTSYANTTNFVVVEITDNSFTQSVVFKVYVLSEVIGNVRLNEIHWDPAPGVAGDANGDGVSDTTKDEFVEVVNANTSAVDITGWELRLGTNVLFTFPPTVFTGRTAVVVFGGGTPVGLFGHSIVYAPAINWAGLANSPGTRAVELRTAEAALVDSQNYSAYGAPDMAITRNPDYTGGYTLHTNVIPFVRWTPGQMANGAYFEGTGITNAPPLLAEVENRSAVIGVGITVDFTAYDPESNAMAFTLSNAPPTASLRDNGDGTALMSYTASVTEAGTTYTVTVSVADGIGAAAWRTFTISVLDSTYAGLVINEFCANPSTTYDTDQSGTVDAEDDEFIEIVNNTTGTLDLAGCIIYDGASLRHRFGSVVLPEGGSVVVFGGNAFSNFWYAPAQAASSGGLGLNNSAPEVIILYTPNTNEVARYAFEENPPVGASWTRYPDFGGAWTNHYLVTTNSQKGSPGRGVHGALFFTNVTPVWRHVPNPTSTESNAIQFNVFAMAYDGDTLTVTVSNLPPGATFSNTSSIGLTTGIFTWASATPAGIYTTLLYAADKDGVNVTSVTWTISGAPPPTSHTNVWINEIHYDNAGLDVNEGVELAGRAGLDLAQYSLYCYNGGNGAVYTSVVCSGILDDEACGYGAAWFAIPGLQNGASDAVALVYSTDTTVIQFLSYEGTMIAASGPAQGLLSTDIGVQEDSNNPVGHSLQLRGTGTAYEVFVWTTPAPASRGSLNDGQSVCLGASDADGDSMPDEWETTHFGCATCAVANADSDSDGFSNLEEYLADTVPVGLAGSNSYFVIENITNTATRYIEFRSSTGRLYTLQGTANPMDAESWSNLANEIFGSGGTMSLSATNAVERQMFRVRVRVP